MSNAEILEKALEKAIDGGWNQQLVYIHGNVKDKWLEFKKKVDICNTQLILGCDQYASIEEVIFNHNFAKALWGDSWKEDCKTCGFTHYMYDKDQYDDEQADPYIYHLQQMVISDDPLHYLADNIGE